MRKTAISAALAAALSLGLAPAPAVADTTRAERIAIGAAILLLGAAIHQNQQERRQTGAVATDRSRVDVRPAGPQALPAACLRSYDTYQGTLRLFDGACLEHSYPAYRHLPLACAVTIRDGSRYSSGYRPECLRSAGYRLAGY